MSDKELDALKAKYAELEKELVKLTAVAEECDSWKSFPSCAIDRALDALENCRATCLAEIEARSVEIFADEMSKSAVFTCFSGENEQFYIDCAEKAFDYANQLRRQAEEE